MTALIYPAIIRRVEAQLAALQLTLEEHLDNRQAAYDDMTKTWRDINGEKVEDQLDALQRLIDRVERAHSVAGDLQELLK